MHNSLRRLAGKQTGGLDILISQRLYISPVGQLGYPPADQTDSQRVGLRVGKPGSWAAGQRSGSVAGSRSNRKTPDRSTLMAARHGTALKMPTTAADGSPVNSGPRRISDFRLRLVTKKHRAPPTGRSRAKSTCKKARRRGIQWSGTELSEDRCFPTLG